jgi:hypothetical protein
MIWQIVAGVIVAIVFGPAILAVLIPSTSRSPAFCFISGGLQIAVGVALYLLVYIGGGLDWHWALLVSLLGIYYVAKGLDQRDRKLAKPEE